MVVAVAVLLAAAGAILLTVGVRAQRHAPQPPPSAATPYATSSIPRAARGGDAAPAPQPTTTGLLLAASTPTHLDIPVIGVHSALLQLGLNPDHSVQVPPLGRDSQAGVKVPLTFLKTITRYESRARGEEQC